MAPSLVQHVGTASSLGLGSRWHQTALFPMRVAWTGFESSEQW